MRQRPNDPAAKEQAHSAAQQAKRSAEEAGLFEASPDPAPAIEPSLKEAYRRAVKQLHPDLATTERERQRRTELMAQVNLAYERGDQKMIEKMIEDYTQDPDAITGDDMGARIVKAMRRIAQLRRRLNELQHEIEAEKKCEIFELRQRVESAEVIGGDRWVTWQNS